MNHIGLRQNMQVRAEQRLIQSPQMIQAMKILQCPMVDLQEQIEQELSENVFLEVVEGNAEEGERSQNESREDNEESVEQSLGRELDQLEDRMDYGMPPGRANQEEADKRYEMLLNTARESESLAAHLMQQVGELDLRPELQQVMEHLVFSLDHDGRLAETAEQIAEDLMVPIPLVEEAVAELRALDPAGVGARDLQDCLLLQLELLQYVPPLTRQLVSAHLDDLAMNRLPKIAKDNNTSIEAVKEAWEFLRTHLNPHPGAAFNTSANGTVTPDVLVEEVEGQFEVRSQRGDVPELRISPTYRKMLKEAQYEPKIAEFLKRKIEAAKWFIESIHQRQNTITRIATEIVKRQEGFLREGVKALVPMKMQDVADAVGVHISTVSRAVNGKYIQTPQGILEMKRFFSGGTVTESGDMMSQQAIKQLLDNIVAKEDKKAPYSDDQLVELLKERGVTIARRTVTKYRKALGIESSSRRKEY